MNKILSILNIEFLVKDDAFKNWRMILFLSFLALIMIASGHSADRKIFKIASLNADIRALKSDFIEGKKVLMVLKKETTVTKVLFEKGIGPSDTTPIKITISNE